LGFAVYPLGPCLLFGACDLEFAGDAAALPLGFARLPRLGFAVYPLGPCLLFGACDLEFAV
jgi:hypothetical protein